jgi:hypothetical protein
MNRDLTRHGFSKIIVANLYGIQPMVGDCPVSRFLSLFLIKEKEEFKKKW